ncbi:hypothetical protein HAX54_004458 [Datura stramonium]|uniref:Uncharacterized protein n=1 Tax=Datura stramonium TaxID=4076 RepID=A0ABS8T8B3_DATST|nr:hypothetical protein [Datura stramonium]
MSGQRMTSQMIPTPGFNASAGANLNSKHQCTVFHEFGLAQHHVGGGIRSGFHNRSYGQSTGPLNGGALGMIGNNMHLVNGSASESYIPAATQHFDQQHQPLMQQPPLSTSTDKIAPAVIDMVSAYADTSGSGNLCLPVSSVGMVMNNQKPGAKLQNQQHQILSRSNAFAQAQLSSDLGIQVKSETGNHTEAQHSRVNAEQFQFSDINQVSWELLDHPKRQRAFRVNGIPSRKMGVKYQKVARPGCNSDMPNSANGTCTSYGSGECQVDCHEFVPVQTEDLQPSLKRTKIEQIFSISYLETENCFMPVTGSESHQQSANASFVEQHGNAMESEGQ